LLLIHKRPALRSRALSRPPPAAFVRISPVFPPRSLPRRVSPALAPRREARSTNLVWLALLLGLPLGFRELYMGELAMRDAEHGRPVHERV